MSARCGRSAARGRIARARLWPIGEVSRSDIGNGPSTGLPAGTGTMCFERSGSAPMSDPQVQSLRRYEPDQVRRISALPVTAIAVSQPLAGDLPGTDRMWAREPARSIPVGRRRGRGGRKSEPRAIAPTASLTILRDHEIVMDEHMSRVFRQLWLWREINILSILEDSTAIHEVSNNHESTQPIY